MLLLIPACGGIAWFASWLAGYPGNPVGTISGIGGAGVGFLLAAHLSGITRLQLEGQSDERTDLDDEEQ